MFTYFDQSPSGCSSRQSCHCPKILVQWTPTDLCRTNKKLPTILLSNSHYQNLNREKGLDLTPLFGALCTQHISITPAAAAAASLQSCPTLCDPIDGSPPGSPVPRILGARTLEWVATSFSNA